ncbi:MAG: hypothetical protein V2I82_02070 [Halieaceae bacterium]|jgi:hypothetical protein|nr:hypothetical protein [Halieaceae bacterium]
MLQDSSSDALASSPSLELYFTEQLQEHRQSLRPPPADDTLWYLSHMLARFGRSESLFAYEDGRFDLRPLALLYGDAMEAEDDHQRCLFLQQLGDMALFLGALFPERFTRRGIQQDYVVGMGGSAYDYLAGNARGNRHVFQELAGMFTKLLELVAVACSRDAGASDETILALYQRWMHSRDPIIARQLRGLGIQLPEDPLMH